MSDCLCGHEEERHSNEMPGCIECACRSFGPTDFTPAPDMWDVYPYREIERCYRVLSDPDMYYVSSVDTRFALADLLGALADLHPRLRED